MNPVDTIAGAHRLVLEFLAYVRLDLFECPLFVVVDLLKCAVATA